MRNISYIRNMALTKKAVGIIVALIVISLTGLVVIQVYLLGSSVALMEQTFAVISSAHWAR